MKIKSIIPVLRNFNEDKVKEFYVDFLGFEIEFEHREENTPLYLGLIKSGFRLHLSEHYGDSTFPITSIRIELDDLELFHKKLTDKNYEYCKPSIIKQDWGTMEMLIDDPFGNRLVFYKNIY